MDNDLGANDPYRGMASGEENITPNFLKKNNGESASDKLGKVEQAAQLAMAAKGGKAPSGKSDVSKGSLDGDIGGAPRKNQNGSKYGAEKAEEKESSPNLYNKNSQKQDDNGETQLKMSRGMKSVLMAAAPFLVVLLIVGRFIALLVGLPVAMIGAIDYNLMEALGFKRTVAILEEVGEYVTEEFLSNGEVPNEYFRDLVANGIDVGQVTANGDFVRTDTYIANIENRDDLVASASGFSYVSEEEGELAVLWNGKVIYADNFVAEIESDPYLYAAYSKAADVGAKYYYSDDVEDVYNEMGVSRGNFSDWESTGNYEEDEKNYYDILRKVLGKIPSLEIGGFLDNAMIGGQNASSEGQETNSGDGGTFIKTVKVVNDVASLPDAIKQDLIGIASGVATELVDYTGNKIKEYITGWAETTCGNVGSYVQMLGDLCYSAAGTSANGITAYQRAVQLFNTMVSSSEPFTAAATFVAVEEPIQKARVEGGGPVNIAMNALADGKEVTYADVETGEKKTSNDSILETTNFKAAVSDSSYSKTEAQNFGRDRVMKVLGENSKESIQNTTIATNGSSNSSAVVRNGIVPASNMEKLNNAKDTLSLALVETTPDLFQTVVGGNRAIEGGSFLSNSINMQVIGAMPSNENKISEYHKDTEIAMARQAEAERVTKSPFDISSPYTFLGSIVHNIGMAVVRNYNSGAMTLSAITSAGDATTRALGKITGSAVADGGDNEYATMSGDGCDTVGTIGVVGDLYCNSHNTPSTKYKNWTLNNFKASIIGGDIGDNGEIVDRSGLSEFVVLGMDRYSTVGIKSTDICEKYNESFVSGNAGLLDKLKRTLSGAINRLFGNSKAIYEPCDVGDDGNIDEEKLAVFTGAKYSFGTQNDNYIMNELYSAYVMYDEVKSLLSNKQSAVSVLRDSYYAEHPKDNSITGVLARRSGMNKQDVEIALAYADYLNQIAMYNPSERFDFIAPIVSFEKPLLEYHSSEVAVNLYAWYTRQTEYEDLRTRNFVI